MTLNQVVVKIVAASLPDVVQEKIIEMSNVPLYPPLPIRKMIDGLNIGFSKEDKEEFIYEIKLHEYRIKRLFKNVNNVTEIEFDGTIIKYYNKSEETNRKKLIFHMKNPHVSTFMCSTMLYYLPNVHTLVLIDPQIFFDYKYVPKTLKTLVIKNDWFRRTLKYYLGSLKKDKILYDNLDNIFIYRNNKLKYSLC